MPKHECLLRFKVHQLKLGGKHYLLLPKLNRLQVGILEKRLAKSGFSVERGAVLTARSRQGAIYIAKSGLCWSFLDPSDSVLPAVPDLLASPREKVPLTSLKRAYLGVSKSGRASVAHLFPRLERSSLWTKLRATDGCGLAPDEHAVASFVLERATGRCEILTDFFVDGAMPHIYGRRRYFDSMLEPDEAASALRQVEARHPRNSYLSREGTIVLEGLRPFRELDWRALLEELGEWCFFTPP
jgi:hypothetical protein